MNPNGKPKSIYWAVILALLIAMSSISYYYVYIEGDYAPTNQESESVKSEDKNRSDRISPKEAENIIKERANTVMETIKNENFIKLSEYVHPEKGVRFTPYPYVDLDSDVLLSRNEIRNILANSRTFKWGYFDGSGKPINMPFMEYYESFVYNQDFLNAPEVSYNEPLSHGNTINNTFEAYPGSIVVEYYFPGFDPQYDGMDWESLKLVFEEYEDEWYLTGIVHNSWTI